jgi:hypothetical protein
MTNMSDFMPKQRNMYGCTRCPECGEPYRYVLADRPKVIRCDDCGHEEPTNEDNYSYHTE